MKRPIVILSIAAFAAITLLPSCKNCWTCYKGSSKAMVCRDDFNNEQTFEDAYNQYLAFGYTCE